MKRKKKEENNRMKCKTEQKTKQTKKVEMDTGKQHWRKINTCTGNTNKQKASLNTTFIVRPFNIFFVQKGGGAAPMVKV